MAKWFLVRHAATAWNGEGRAQGHTDVPLNDLGRRQTERLAARLVSVPFSAAYSSDLKRVVETAEPVLQGGHTRLHTTPELREKSYGAWEGRTFEEVRVQEPQLYQRLFEDDISFAPPGGESDEDLVRRVGPVGTRLRASYNNGEDIFIAAHGGSLRALLVCLLDLPFNSLWRFKLDNASLSILSVRPEGVMVDLWNDTSHLEGLVEK